MSAGREPRAARRSDSPRLEPSRPSGAPAEEVDLPATTRIGRGRTPDRTLRAATILAVAAIGLALVKPWDWGAPATPLAGPDRTTAPTAAPAASAAPPPRSWTDLDAVSCLSNRLWMAVVDEAEDGGATLTRSWTRLDPVPAAGPTDAGIVRAHAYAGAVPRIGFCAPTHGATARARDRHLVVETWLVEPGDAPGAATAVPIDPLIVAGGLVADGGALYGPPAAFDTGPGQGDHDARGDPVGPSSREGPADAEATWSADGDASWRPAGWSTGPGPPDAGGWRPGVYVFRVGVPGSAPGGLPVAWFAVELRGPWLGPDAEAPGPGAPPIAPGSGPLEPTSRP